MPRILCLLAVMATAIFAAVSGAAAQGYPNRHITLIMAFPPGGGSDAAARLVSDHMATTLGQPIVMEPVTGAAGMIGAARAARSEPDGYTLLVHQLALASGVSLFSKLGFDPEKDLVPIGIITSSPVIVIGRKSLPVDTLAALPDWMKRNSPIKFAHAGPGSLAHLCAAQFSQAVGAQVDLIPYRGGGPANSDIIAGHVDLMCSNLAGAIPQIRGGLVKGFGVSAREPVAALPEVPSLVQVGGPALEMQHWHGLFAPAGTPRPIVDKLNAALRKAINDPRIRKAFADVSANEIAPDQQTPEALGALLHSEIKRWGDVIRAAKIEMVQ
jgi:tripartite-type tricarboxylate transporter receptor subunit TctC